ncbi:type II secretion system protein [Candidatus Roizmanbacteria bacterium]|nr:type II secretion system protein [Candidatus Roizmanbacteria bacterium]
MNKELRIRNQVQIKTIIHNPLFIIQSSKGFTFVELILYVSIVTIMLTAIVPFGWSAIASGVKSSVQQEVYSQARFVSERLKQEIRQASGITNVSTNSISLTNLPPDTNTDIDLSSGKIRINKNGTGFVNLNSDNTSITNLVFTNYSSVDQKTKHIGFELTIASNYSGQRQEYNETVTLRGSAEARSN